jgi:hypothetical protein
MTYPSQNISKRDWAMQKEKKKRRKVRYARKHDIKKEEEIAHVSNISKREEKIMHKGV